MIKQTVTCDRCGKDITKSYFFSCQMDSLNISGDTDCIPVKSFELCKDCADIIYNEITNNKSNQTPSAAENSDEKRIRESGVMYLECPVCNHVFFNYEKTRHTIKCYCKHCDKEYYGFDKGDEVIFSEEGSIFTPYKNVKWKRGK